MKKFLTVFYCVLLALVPRLSLWAGDFGLVLDQTAGYGGYGNDGKLDYSGMLIPRFSSLVGNSGSFYVSAGVKADYQNDTWVIVPELLRTEFSWSFSGGDFSAGRMYYSDPLGFIAEGLFDGVRFSLDTEAGSFSAGAWYTGLLYKNRANITMTPRELKSSAENTDYSDFINTYFAPRRIVSALEWENPSLGDLLKLNLSLLGQSDLLNGDRLNSQYLVGKITLPYSAFVFSLGGCFELLQSAAEDNSIALAGELGVDWMLPTPIEDQLSLTGRFSSGVVNNSSIVAFLPVTTVDQGELLKPKLSGMSVVSLNYTARLLPALSANITSSYFIRSDLGTYSFGSDGYFLGNEFFGRLLWSPVSDVQVNLGGGIFMPSLGDAAPKSDNLWRVELNVILALY